MEHDRAKALCLGILQRQDRWMTITDILPLLHVDTREFKEDWLMASLYNALQSLVQEERVETKVGDNPHHPSEAVLLWHARPVQFKRPVDIEDS